VNSRRLAHRRPLARVRRPPEDDQLAFWALVEVSDDIRPCWMWLGKVSQTGYGFVKFDGVWSMAHRVSWELAYSASAEGWQILHACDVPGCVNPRHLRIGDRAENVADDQAKKYVRRIAAALAERKRGVA
jgi:HNH endonuclease